MFPLTMARSTPCSMQRPRCVCCSPLAEALRERFGDDRQKMSQGMMELYKKEKVNPLGGCLPILVQMPIFIALYWALMELVVPATRRSPCGSPTWSVKASLPSCC